MICEILLVILSRGCNEAHMPRMLDEVETRPPTVIERIRSSSDGKSMWEWKWELMTGQEFDRQAAESDDLIYVSGNDDSEKTSCPRGFVNDEGDFIPFSAERRAACEEK